MSNLTRSIVVVLASILFAVIQTSSFASSFQSPVPEGAPSNIRLEGTILRWDDNTLDEERFQITVQPNVTTPGSVIVHSISVGAGITSFDLATDSRTYIGGSVFVSVGAITTTGVLSSDFVPFDLPAACPEGMRLTVTLSVERAGDRQETIPGGSSLIVRGARGTCASSPVDATALNALQPIVVDLAVPKSDVCGTPGETLSIEIEYPTRPGEARSGTQLASIGWEDGRVTALNLVVRAPIPIPGSPIEPPTLPPTGTTTNGEAKFGYLPMTLVLVGGWLVLGYAAWNIRKSRR